MSQDKITVDTAFTLREWFKLVQFDVDPKNAPYARIARYATRLGVTRTEWQPNQVGHWLNRKTGINHRPYAIAMIAVLRQIARENDVRLFDDVHLMEHAKVFLASAACGYSMFGELGPEDINFIMQHSPGSFPILTPQQHSDNLHLIRKRVKPEPPSPQHFFGRATDINRLTAAVLGDNQLITVIDAPGGEGKTALAWIVAANLIGNRDFERIDWTTDKRFIITSASEYEDLKNDGDLAFHNILRSMVFSFGWTDLYHRVDMPGDQSLIEAHCADQLRKQPYLIVVDNLETTEHAEDILRRLSDLLTPTHSSQARPSRAIVTSRVWLEHPEARPYAQIGRVNIVGIDAQARVPFLQHLQGQWRNQAPMSLSASQLQHLADATQGNPLMMQIAMRRSMFALNAAQVDGVIDSLKSGRSDAFDKLFGDVLVSLPYEALQLAYFAAEAATYADNGIIDAPTLWYQWQALHAKPDAQPMEDVRVDDPLLVAFQETLALLANNCVMSRPSSDGFNMHPLIQAYLLRKRNDNADC